MEEKMTIKPLVGINDLKFGSSKDKVEEYLGKPYEIEQIDAEGDDSDAEVWNYDDYDMSAFFEKEFDDLLTCFDVSNNDFMLFGKRVFDLSKDQVIELMKDNGFVDHEVEDEEWGEHRLSYNDAVMDFYYEDGSLASVSWGVMIDEQENVQWP